MTGQLRFLEIEKLARPLHARKINEQRTGPGFGIADHGLNINSNTESQVAAGSILVLLQSARPTAGCFPVSMATIGRTTCGA